MLGGVRICSQYNRYCSIPQAGSSVYVISRINGDWLYGESNGKVGQFPASFVDRIPSNLPQRTNWLAWNYMYNENKLNS